MRRVILASGSSEIREIFEKLDIPFEVQIGNFEGNLSQDLSPEEFLKALSEGIVKDISRKNPNSLIMTVESIIYFEGKKYMKPKGRDDYKQMLIDMRGKQHTVITGYMVLDNKSGQYLFRVEETRACFRNFSDQQIEEVDKLLKDFPESASGASLRSAGMTNSPRKLESTNEIRGFNNYFNIVGLSTERLTETLREFKSDPDTEVKKSEETDTFEQPKVLHIYNNLSDNQYSDHYGNQENAVRTKNLFEDNKKTRDSGDIDFLRNINPNYSHSLGNTKDSQPSGDKKGEEFSRDIFSHSHRSSDDTHRLSVFKKDYSQTEIDRESKKINSQKDYDDIEKYVNKEHKRLHSKLNSVNPLRKLRRERSPARIESDRNIRRLSRRGIDSFKDESDRNEKNEKNIKAEKKLKEETKEYESKKRESSKKEDSDSIFLRFFLIFGYIVEGIKWIFGQDVIARFIIALIAGILLFGIIFNWFRMLPNY